MRSGRYNGGCGSRLNLVRFSGFHEVGYFTRPDTNVLILCEVM